MRLLFLLLPTLIGCGGLRATSFSIASSQSVTTDPAPAGDGLPSASPGSPPSGTLPSAGAPTAGAPTSTPPAPPAILATAACPALMAKLNQDVDAAKELQACVDGVPTGMTLALPPGFVTVASTINVTRAITLRTVGLGDAAACPASDPSGCFELRARPETLITPATGLLHVTGTGAGVRNVVVNGNRAVRLQSFAAGRCKVGDNGYGFNLSVDGQSIRVEGVVSKNALCGTGFVVNGKMLEINRNLVVGNGQHGDNLWSDGITVKDAADASFVGNQVRDNSDVDFIFGGCQRCTIHDNLIAHGSNFSSAAYAAFMFHAWPNGGSSGDYTGTEVTANQVDCGPLRRCGIGLYLGAESWYTAPLFGGYWHDNQVTNALTGFLVERPSGLIRIKDNLVTNSGGATLTSQGDVTMGYAYNIPFREAGVLSIEDTKIPLSAYAAVTMARKIPLDPSRDVAFTQTADTAGRVMNAASFTLNLYRVLLGRQPSHAEVETYDRPLVARQLTRADVLRAFETSDEHLTAEVTKAYQQILKRAPDASGLATWFAFIRGGALIRQMWVEIATSPEGLGRARTATDYAAGMYRYMLGREGSASEVANLAAAYAADPAQTVRNFIASAEMGMILLNEDYAWLLNRGVDPSGAQSWLAFLAAGHSPADLRAAIAMTSEARD